MSFRHEPRHPEATLVVVADRGQARMFTASGPEFESVTELGSLIHPESRVREHDTVSDKPGRFRTPAGQRSATDEASSFRHQTAEKFAREVCVRMEAARINHEFGRLVVAAPPLFLGELRHAMSPELKALTVIEIDQDLVRESKESIVNRVLSHGLTLSAAH